jgi:FixJ family two-component response regulator
VAYAIAHAEPGNCRLPKVPMISIVDDDESVRESTKELVESLGYEALAFASAEEFLESERARATSCLITDLQMRGLSGVDLQRRLLDEGRGIPIIFITAFPDEKTRSHVLDAGAIGFLTKPFSDEKLITHLDTALADFGSGTPSSELPN